MKQLKRYILLLSILTLLCSITIFTSCSNACLSCTFGPWEVLSQPTCTTDGMQQRVCIDCGRATTATLPATGHQMEKDESISDVPTFRCKICGETEYGPVCSHESASWEIIYEATCTHPGLKRLLCSNLSCDILDEETIPMLDHQPGDWIIETPNTCSEDGKRCQKCTVCNEVVSEEIIRASHTLGDWIVEKDATCTEDGRRYQACSVCQAKINQELIPAAHTIVTISGSQATCETSGKTDGKRCSTCGETLVQQQAIPALGHAWVTDAAVAATCEKNGLTEGSHCKNCQYVRQAQNTIPKLSHTIVTDAAIDATCTDAGKTVGSHCSSCNNTIVAQEVIPALGHSFNMYTNTCSKCSTKEFPEILSRNEAEGHQKYAQVVLYLDKCVTIANQNEGITMTVRPEQTYIRLVGTTGVTYNLVLKVEGNRTQDLTIDFVNAKLKAIFDTPVIDIACKNTTVTLGFYGDDCQLLGKDGSKGSSGIDIGGGNGKDGKNGQIAVKSVGNVNLVISANYVEVRGGNGGNGGNGGDGPVGGNGGDGGNGAFAISANAIRIVGANGHSSNEIFIIGGSGGTGGKKGQGVVDGKRGKDGSDTTATNITPTYQ